MMDLDNIPDTQTEAEELEEVVMGLIINSGQARSLAYAALKQAKSGAGPRSGSFNDVHACA